jgi:hypothetical protein
MLYQLSYSRDMRNADRGASRRVLAQNSSAYRRTHVCVFLRCTRDHLPHPLRSVDTEPLRPGVQSRRPESNRRPADYKSAALPSELRRPAGSLPANVVVCCSTGFRLRHPCYGKRLSPVRSVSFGPRRTCSSKRSAGSQGRGLRPLPRFLDQKGKTLFGNHRSKSVTVKLQNSMGITVIAWCQSVDTALAPACRNRS